MVNKLPSNDVKHVGQNDIGEPINRQRTSRIIGTPKLWHLSGGNRHRTVFVPVPSADIAEIQSRSPRGTYLRARRLKNNAGAPMFRPFFLNETGDLAMDSVIYLVGLVVVIMAILSFFGLR